MLAKIKQGIRKSIKGKGSKMRLEVLRFSDSGDSTSSLLFDVTDGRRFLCYALEDEYRRDKVRGETRIPAGAYKLGLRKVGGFHERYSTRFSDIHRGMLEVIGVPNFDYILIHCGNTDEHTDGCLLVGDTQENNLEAENGFVGKSAQAYKRIYPAIAEALERGKEVVITYVDFDN
jgi:hypothetical protein